jgi:hypothetical protein
LTIANQQFDSCFFDNCSLAADPGGAWHRLEGLEFVDCMQRASMVAGAWFRDVTVEGLSKDGDIPLFLSAVVFQRVHVSGSISAFKINPAPHVVPTASQLAAWRERLVAAYSEVDWALDISEAKFSSAPTLEWVPGALVRRDEETQVLVTRNALSDVDLRSLPWGKSSMEIGIEWFLKNSPFDSCVLPAAKRSRTTFKQDMNAISMLRRERLGV